MDSNSQEILDLNAAEYLVAVKRGKHPHTSPARYLAYAVRMGAKRERTLELAAEIEAGRRPLSRYMAQPFYLQADGTVAPTPRSVA